MNPKVRSVTLDRWTPDLVEAMERAGGNASVNACYEALLPHTQTQAKTDRCVRVCVVALLEWDGMLKFCCFHLGTA